MLPHALFAAFLSTTLCIALAAQTNQNPATNLRSQIIGTWQLVSAEEQLTDGSKRPYQDIGPHAKGYLIYTADGHMCATAMNPDRPAWKDAANPTDTEKLRAIEGFFSYCGRYEIDEPNHTLYHYPDVAWMPNFVGTKQVRPYKLDGQLLVLSGKATDQPGVDSWIITWRKK